MLLKSFSIFLKFLSIYITGILCKHAIRVLTINEVFILPTQYILNRWTKYAKRGFYCEKREINDNETSKAQCARISGKVTSLALKCSVSKDLLDDLEKAIDKLDQEADTTLNQRPAEPCVVSRVSTECETDILKGKVSIGAPEVIKGPKKKREDVLEKKGKKKKTTNRKGKTPNSKIHYFPSHFYS